MFEKPLDDATVISCISNEIPRMTEAQLAELLTNLFLGGPSVIATEIMPQARMELHRRRMEQAERVSLSM